MEMIFICKDGDFGSLLSHFVDAKVAREAGEDAGLVVAEEALWAIATGKFTPRPALDEYINWDVIRGAGFPTDCDGLLTMARQSGVPIVACGGWTAILGLQGKLPEGVTVGQIGPILLEAKKIVGGF